MMKIPSIIPAAVLVGTLCALLSSCGTRNSPALISNDWAIGLPEGYQIVRTCSDVVVVQSPDTTVVGPTVDAYKSYPAVLVGHAHKCTDPRACADSVPGYFIVDYKTGKAQKGLSKKQLLSKLRSYGIRRMPQLEPI